MMYDILSYVCMGKINRQANTLAHNLKTCYKTSVQKKKNCSENKWNSRWLKLFLAVDDKMQNIKVTAGMPSFLLFLTGCYKSRAMVYVIF